MENVMVRLANAIVKLSSFGVIVDGIVLVYGIGYAHICPVCMKSASVSNPCEKNIQKVVKCECCGSKYVTKIGKPRKNIQDAIVRSKWNLY